MKHILCYGDSNTWGFNPANGERFDRNTRWAGVLRNTLGSDYDIAEEGLNGRTTVFDDPTDDFRNGRAQLMPCLLSHRPLDLVIILLGTNDLKSRFGATPFDIAQGVATLARMVFQSQTGPGGRSPQVLLLAPPPVARFNNHYGPMFKGAEPKSRQLGEHYARVAQELGCEFLDTQRTITSSNLDGIHLEAGEHAKLGQAVAEKVRSILPAD